MLLTQRSTTRIAVTVTFLRLDLTETVLAPMPLPDYAALVPLTGCTVPFYRYLYSTVGREHVWWMRTAMPDASLDAILRDPAVLVFVLYAGGEPAGFFELDVRNRPTVNLSYFGLLPHATGRGLGRAFLGAALDTAAGQGAQAITVNTCTADHPRALPGYIAAGFRPVRTVRELWDVPTALGLPIPEHLRT